MSRLREHVGNTSTLDLEFSCHVVDAHANVHAWAWAHAFHKSVGRQMDAAADSVAGAPGSIFIEAGRGGAAAARQPAPAG